jgi:phosphohistidine phosphatase
MRLMIIRHAEAVPRGTPGIEDDARPLTAEGERRFAEAAAGLARVAEPPAVLLSSPLPRALRTAELAAAAWGGLSVKKLAALASGEIAGLERALASHPKASTIAVVGHEPYLSQLLAHAISVKRPEAFDFKKGGVALVDLPDGLSARDGRLLWYVTPKVLRALGGAQA